VDQERNISIELNREIGELKAKLDMVLDTVKDLKTNYVTVEAYRSLETRVNRIENAPTKWLPIIISAVSLLMVFITK